MDCLGSIIKDSKTTKSLDDTVSQLIDFQRDRIRNLEQEYDSLYEKYEEVIRSKFVTADQGLEDILNKGLKELKSKADGENFVEMVQQYAKEISTMKAKMTEQGAKILLHKEDSYFMPGFELPSMHKSGALK